MFQSFKIRTFVSLKKMSPRIRWKNNYSKMGLRKKEWFSMVFSFHLDCLYSFIFFLHSSSFCFSPYSGKHFLTKTCTEFSLPFKDIFESPSLDRNCNFLEGWTLHKKLRCFFLWPDVDNIWQSRFETILEKQEVTAKLVWYILRFL